MNTYSPWRTRQGLTKRFGYCAKPRDSATCPRVRHISLTIGPGQFRRLLKSGRTAVPRLIEALDKEQRNHAITKLAFTLRTIGDPRAVPALIRAIPRTLCPSRSDYGLCIADPALLAFMQRHDLSTDDAETFDYNRAFTEVTGALEQITGTELNEHELHWVDLGETEQQRVIQRELFHRLAARWSAWWAGNWRRLNVDEQYAEVNLPLLAEGDLTRAGPGTSLPVGPKLSLTDWHENWIIQSAQESRKRCFVDLDTLREAGWPTELPPAAEIGVSSDRALRWARKQGFDLLGITYKPRGYDAPLYCLLPLDLKAWEITPEEQIDLPRAMRGEIPYPLGKPVDRLVPRKEVYKGPNRSNLGGTAFLFLTREGTAGLLRMTAQVTDTNVEIGKLWSPDDQFSPVGFYTGAKVGFSIHRRNGRVGSNSPRIAARAHP